MYKEIIDTPSLIVDLDILEKNMKTMSSFFAGKKSCVRPHAKSCKTPAIIKKQLDMPGAKGVTVSKVSEAEAMADGGIDDILIANEIVGTMKIRRLINLAKRVSMIVAVDNILNARELSQMAETNGLKLDVLVDVDIGLDRCGVQPGRSTLDFVRQISTLKGLRFRGLMAFEGGLYKFEDFEARKKECLARLQKVGATKALLEDNRIEVEILSAGGTNSYKFAGEFPGVTEVQAGAYLLMDAHDKYRMQGSEVFDCAAFILTTVMSKSAQKVIADMGTKSVSAEHAMPRIREDGTGEGISLERLNEEHAVLRVTHPHQNVQLGDKLEFIPGHICGTTNLHEKIYGVRNGELEVVWDITARGKSQ